MDSSAMACTWITLVLVIMILPFGPSWFMAFPVLIGMIALSFDRRRRRSTENPVLPVRAGDAPPRAGDAPAPAPDRAGDTPPPAGDAPAPAPAGDTPPPSGDVPAPAPAPAPAGDTPPPAGDAPAPAPAGDTPPPAGDVPAPATAGDTPPPAGDAPAPAPDPAGDAPPPAGDASAPALAVVAAGNKSRKPESSSTSSSSRTEYDVFLSFRGADTRKGFTDHLYSRLVGTGISVFKDDEEHRVEEELPPKLIEAIKQSRISIPILSRDYASSKWCLWELVQMMKRRKLNGPTTIPIFYDVSPSEVRHQAGEFGRAFDLHERKVGSDTIEIWKEALRTIGELRGYSGKLYKGYEGQLVEEIAVNVAQRLRDDDLVAADKLVGIDLHVQEMMRKLGVAYSKGQATEVRGEDVRVVGICGVPGVRKTTLAKVVFNKLRDLFDACTFLPGISSKGVQFSRRMLIADLQMQKPAPLETSGEVIEEIASLCRNAKVLIVLDDVDEDEQIKALVGNLTWFGPGSRIIVTTNKRKVLSAFDVGADDPGTVEEYEVEPMSNDQSLEISLKTIDSQAQFKTHQLT